MRKVHIVGLGPGSRDYLTLKALKVIQKADVLIGARRHLSLFSKFKKKTIYLKENYSKVLKFILQNKDKKNLAVLVSGDPGIFSFSAQITKRLKPYEYEVVPGISSLQLSFARIGESWEDVIIFSLHGRTKRGLKDAVSGHKKVFLLTDKKNNPRDIASFLFRKGIRKRKVFVFKNLSLGDEEIIKTDVETIKDSKDNWNELCVMLIKK
ncbi:MAG: precorrin-6y C5,15-methyltransferase (decarboxylating) subunit CbiE [Candidatus Hydrogenedentota bacterium]